MNVTIDGIRYVPATDIPVVSSEAHLHAVKALVTALYLYSPRDRGTNGCIWGALKALAPDVAELAGEDPRKAHDAVEALEQRAQEEHPDECPGAGECHGCMAWCPACGDNAARICPDIDCDVHHPTDEDGVRAGSPDVPVDLSHICPGCGADTTSDAPCEDHDPTCELRFKS